MLNKRIAAALAGASIASATFLAPAATADEILEIGGECFIENVVVQEEVVGTETVAEPVDREGDWPVGDVEGPEGWTFDPETGDGTITADIPENTPAGEYDATVYHFGYSKNQVSENTTFKVVERDITESRTWTERVPVPCAGDEEKDDSQGPEEWTEASQQMDVKVLAQQQALNAAAAPAAPAPAAAEQPAEVTPAPAAQQTQLADNGIGGALTALAVGLVAVGAGAALLLRRRTN
ncbi:hypothetical protein EAH68_04395 [Corynebacterium hylobatis]|uniref:LPXTG cell wall anchor domain-containing protein n=1 Tax=Corynebacterium hylobatis TaxID=1859290 RepID=A0A430HZ91_9CORY|nr:hypothetical protein [Corynebacterium hylobatis]RSZ64247.1 hypothetical protein EAH68_04395 [Corynebacterium hylobatis]